MIESRISNIKLISQSYNSVESNVKATTKKLRNDYDQLLRSNVYYKKGASSDLVKAIVIDVILVILFIKKEDALFWIQYKTFLGAFDIPVGIIGILIILVLIYCLYRTGILLYCKRIDGFVAKIDKIENTVNERVAELKNANIINDFNAAVDANSDYKLNVNNDLGKEIAALKNSIETTNQQAYNIKRAISIGLGVILFIVMLVFTNKFYDPYTRTQPQAFIGVLCFVSAVAVINVSQLLMGEYLGKFAKPIGIVEALIYGAVFYSKIKIYQYEAFVYFENIQIPEQINRIPVAIFFIQVVGIILTVCLSHYGLEKEKWDNGFKVPMAYGSKDDGNKRTLLIRGGISLLIALMISAVLLEINMAEDPTSVFMWGVAWYCANCILKPRGSYLYAFWGQKRAIANEFIMAGMVLTGILLYRGTIYLEEWFFLGAMIVISFVAALAARIANNAII